MYLALLLLLLACGTPSRTAPDPRVAALLPLPLSTLEDQARALAGRDDLDALDGRLALELARRNRSPAQVSDDVSALPDDARSRELSLRQTWRQDHVAYGWDNLDPDGQLEPRPEGLHLTWLTLATHLPEARNGWTWDTDPNSAWIDDYYQRKRWYVPRPGPRVLAWMDRIQMDRISQELEALTTDALTQHLASLPAPGMSPEEAALEAHLAQALLEGR